MKAATKILMVNLCAVGVLVVVFFSVCSIILVDSFSNLENNNSRLMVEKARNEIDKDVNALDANTMVYAYWNETYMFALGQNSRYALDSIPDSTFTSLGINVIVILNRTGEMIYRMAYEPGNGELPLPRGFLPHLQKGGLIQAHDYSNGGLVGEALIDEAPYEISCRPILQNNQVGPAAGILIMAKEMDSSYLSRLSALSKSDLRLYPIDEGEMPPYIGTQQVQALQNGSPVIVSIDSDSLVAYSGLKDIYGDTSMVLSADLPRDLYQQATQSQFTLLLLTALIGIALVALTLYLLKVVVINRLERLDDDVRRIGRSGDTSKHLTEDEDDELGNLAASINRMLSALSASETDLIESKRRYEAVIQDQTELILRTSPDFRITFANTAFCKFFESDILSIIGQTFPLPNSFIDQFKPGALLAMISPETPVTELEHQIGRAENESRWLQWSVRGIFDDQGRLLEAQWVGRDVTERMRMIDELNQTEKIESLGVLAGGIAHDFNNMLTSILGTITMMKLDLDRSDPRLERLDESENIVMRATELTKQLLTFSRGGEPIKKPISLPRFAQETARFALRGSDIVLREDLDPGTRRIAADEGQLFQVISNLVVNARQANPRSREIHLRCGNFDVGMDDRTALQPGEYVYLDVEDDGVGIPHENLQKIFDPYFSTKPSGNGLGLTIVHSIVSRHGGQVQVESEEGIGSRFRVILPSIGDAEQGSELVAQVGKVTGRVLLMDDEESILEVTGMLLKEYGYEVECARNGEEAVLLAKAALSSRSRFDVAILDLTVRGGMGGREAVGLLKGLDERLMAIVSSGYSNDPVMASFREYGFDAVVQKPYRIMDMVVSIEELRMRSARESYPLSQSVAASTVRVEQ